MYATDSLKVWHYSGPCSDVYHLGHSKNHWTELNWTESPPKEMKQNVLLQQLKKNEQ